jgi:two-component system sensor histidine kinase DegS
MNQTDISEVEVPEKSEAELMQEKIADQLARTKQEFQEIEMLYDQSELEVNKLTQRNATATTNLQRTQSQFERIPREEIRMAYDAALDAQQRLFVLRGQVEKLRSDKEHLQERIEILQLLDSILSQETVTIKDAQNASETVEMLEMLVQAQEAERLRLSRQMHDGPAQALSNLILETEIAMRLFDVNKEQAYQELGTLRDSASKTFQQVRDFIFELRPMMLDDLGLIPTLKKYVEAVQDTAGNTIKIGVTGTERRMEPYLEVMIFRAVQELLRNALNHSQANQIIVEMDVGESFVQVMVQDDGQGFEVQELEQTPGMGLKLIKERVEMITGDFELTSQIGEGTRILFKVPDSGLGA